MLFAYIRFSRFGLEGHCHCHCEGSVNTHCLKLSESNLLRLVRIVLDLKFGDQAPSHFHNELEKQGALGQYRRAIEPQTSHALEAKKMPQPARISGSSMSGKHPSVFHATSEQRLAWCLGIVFMNHEIMILNSDDYDYDVPVPRKWSQLKKTQPQTGTQT